MEDSFVRLRTEFRELISNSDLSQFSDIPSKLAHLINCDDIRKVFCSRTRNTKYTKNATESLRSREKGNQAVKENKLKQALTLYNIAIRLAPHPADKTEEECLSNGHDAKPAGDPSLSLCLANRAFVLSKINLVKHAIQDLELCLVMDYPDQNRFKIHQRLASAYEQSKQPLAAVQALRNLVNSIDVADIPEEKKRKLRNEARTDIRRLQALGSTGIKNENQTSKIQDEIDIEDRNPVYQSLDSSVQVVEMEGKGRGAVAARELGPGTLIAKERALAAVLYLPKLLSHCVCCGKEVLVPYPCSSCPVTFCSPACIPKHSRFDCSLYSSGVLQAKQTLEYQLASNLQLAFRLITQRNPERHFLHWDDSNREEDGSKQDSFDEDTDDNKYRKTLALMSHLENVDQAEHMSSALVLLDWLILTGYTEDNPDCWPRHLQLCSTFLGIVVPNCHATFHLSPTSQEPTKMSMVGVAIFPDVASSFNHSCDPNTFVVDMGQEQLTFTARTVAPGEELNQIYIGHFGDTAKEKRQSKLLEKYNFNCQCEACSNDYPSTMELLKEAKTFEETPEAKFCRIQRQQDQQTRTEWDEEGKRKLDEKNLEYRERIDNLLAKGDLKQALMLTKERVSLASTNIRSPHILLTMGLLSLIHYSWSLFGNKAATHTRQNNRLTTFY